MSVWRGLSPEELETLEVNWRKCQTTLTHEQERRKSAEALLGKLRRMVNADVEEIAAHFKRYEKLG